MPSTTTSPWQDARTFDDLLGLARAFFAGTVRSFPGWGSGDLDDESDDLEGALLAANGAGILTVASQPGRPFAPAHDDRDWTGRAFVGGFLREDTLDRLTSIAAAEGLLVLVERPGGPPREDEAPTFSVPAGLRDGLPYLVLSSGGRAAELEIFLEEAGVDAHQTLTGLPFAWVIDPVWGRRDALPRTLLRLSDV